MLTDAEIHELIKVEKRIVGSISPTPKLVNRHFKNKMELESIDGRLKFTVFTRQLVEFMEDFSIGLMYNHEGTKLILLRCNGKHAHLSLRENEPDSHAYTHVHLITQAQLERSVLDPRAIWESEKYTSFEEAIEYFCNTVNITNWKDKFPPPNLFGS